MLKPAVVSILLLGSPLGAAEPPRPDAVLADEAREAVRDATIDKPDTVYNLIEVAVSDGVITLSGTVRHKSRAEQLARHLARVPGVRGVRNHLTWPATGAGDERLRRQLVRAVYGSDAFSRYGLFVEPPIRFLVERGRVVLAGRVASRAERDLLGHIARRTEAFEVENAVEVDADVANQPVGGAGVAVN